MSYPPSTMNSELIKKALCFHGKPMQKIWDDERGVGDLQVAGVPEDGNYSIYVDRQKHFTFQDRAKRLKLHQFLARKASDLYDNELIKTAIKPIHVEEDIGKYKNQSMARLPPFETFLTKHQEKIKRCTLESIKRGDIIYAQALRGKRGTTFHLGVKPLCTDVCNFKLLKDYAIKSIIPAQLCGPPSVDKNGTQRTIESNDYVRCEVIDFSIDAERMTLSLTPSASNKNVKLGKISKDELPALYIKLVSNSGMDTYEGYLTQANEMDNPNYDVLYGINGLSVSDNFTLMSSLKHGFPQKEYAKELRQQQASKWAFRSVAEGIDYFKIGQHVEAFQCLNKALNIDPRNVEGLVARGALYANKGLFQKAVEDFEKALKLNSFHVNARKYMGETLVALGRSYEEDNRIQDAAKAYRDCLNIIPKHDQAVMLLEAIQQRTGASVANVSVARSDEKQYEDTTDQLNKLNSSASNGSDSGESSSDSGTDSEGELGPTKKREPSLSPLSKKMALHAQQMESSVDQQPYRQPFFMSSANVAEKPKKPPVIPNEFKLDEDDTESRVRKLLEDASKHKKDKKKTKKSKKLKKSKKSKSLMKETQKHVEYSYIVNTESTLNANLQIVEKSIQELKKRQQKLTEKPSISFGNGARTRGKSETPPPPPFISFGLGGSNMETKKLPDVGERSATQQSGAAARAASLAQKFSFQIKKPVKIDKFGLIRLATPVARKSRTPSPRKNRSRSRSGTRKRSRSRKYSRSRSNSRSRRRSSSRSRSTGRHRRWRSRSRSNSHGRQAGRRGRRSYSNSSSRSGSRSFPYKQRRYDRRSHSRGSIRRTPSPFVPRGTPSPRRYGRRSRSPRGASSWRGGRGRGRGGPSFKFGNRVWKNPKKDISPNPIRKHSSADDRWVHDKFENDDPTIEEIDEIIIKAREERKQNIISNDKDILKKSSKW